MFNVPLAMGALIGITKVVLAWIIAFVTIAAWGRLFKSFWQSTNQGAEQWLSDFWLGLAGVLAFLQIWNLFLPVNWVASSVIAIVAVVTLIWRRDRIRLERNERYFLLICSPVLLWLAYHSLFPPSHVDSGLYHFNMIRWHMEYPVVPGLANLHGRLGFNQSFFLYVAMLNVHPWLNHGHNIAASLMVAVLILQLARATWRLLVDRANANASLLLRVLLLPVLIGAVAYSPISTELYNTISSPALDIPLFVWGSVLFLAFLDYVLPPELDGHQGFAFFEVCALAAAGATMKLSMFGFAAATVAITFAVHVHRTAERAKAVRQAASCSGVIFLLMIVPWMTRGVVLSGYPAYPATFGEANVDWRVPRAEAQRMARIISNWGKRATTKGSEDWINRWIDQHLGKPTFSWPLTLLGVSALALLWLRARVTGDLRHIMVWLPPCVSVAFWFITSPNPRFVGIGLWLVALWPFALALDAFLGVVRAQKRPLACWSLAILQIALVLPLLTRKSPHYAGKVPSSGFCKTPQVLLKQVENGMGLRIWIPVEGGLTWDAPVPAGPVVPPRVKLRGQDLAPGFQFVPAQSASKLEP